MGPRPVTRLTGGPRRGAETRGRGGKATALVSARKNRATARPAGLTPVPTVAGRDPSWWRTAPGPLRALARGEAQPTSAGRYRTRRLGRERVLVCLEAPTLSVRIEPEACVSASAARNAPPGTIYLDGAAQGEPFVDAERDVYNLDHHEGCVRAFTLATCEQAMVLLRRGLDLRRRDFRIHANGADLDSVLAIWVLLNHLRLGGAAGARVRARILPLLRLEGNIDALGFGCEDLCALPPMLLADTQQALDGLLERERAARAGGFGREPIAFVSAQLRAIDRIAYAGEALDAPLEIEELARAELAGLGVAVVCRADGGIYEIERELRRLHGERLALVVLQKDAAHYSLRATQPAAAARLERIYAWLNHADPASGGSRSENRWGGAGEIGGSPRRRGTRLAPAEIAATCRGACAPWTTGSRARRALGVAVVCMALLGLAAAPQRLALPASLGALGLFVSAGLACLAGGRKGAGWYGLRSPRGLAGWEMLPIALSAAALGGVWLPLDATSLSLHPSGAPALAALLCGAAGLELLLRGLAPAGLLPAFHGRARSAAVLLPALLYAAALSLVLPSATAPPAGGALGGACAALLFGLAAGRARERAESIALPLAFAVLGVATRLGLSVAGLIP